ncbi:MAG: hypothetical protein ACTHLE_25250 [Agriterribacter sp.]
MTSNIEKKINFKNQCYACTCRAHSHYQPVNSELQAVDSSYPPGINNYFFDFYNAGKKVFFLKRYAAKGIVTLSGKLLNKHGNCNAG